MPTYISLVNWTEQGITNVKQQVSVDVTHIA